jgi:3-carboxy-cis,cis-muconate cycloisomerase
MEVQVDPGALAEQTGQNGVSVPGLVAAFRDEMKAPEHAQYVHWGATSQDIIDTGLMLRLRQALALAEADLRALLKSLGSEAASHAATPMPARTYGQHATPTSWGAVLAQFGAPLLDALDEMDALRDSSLWVSLSGAAGTAGALGPDPAATRAGLARALGLRDPGRGWHTDRAPLLRISDWQGRVIAALAHIGQTLIGLTATDAGEVALAHAGASSTMPQKENPVAAAAIVALGHHATGLQASLRIAAAHQHQRDGAAWFTEWLCLPQLSLSLAAALTHARALAHGMMPRPVRMHANLDAHLGLIHAEALSFALAATLPRPEAQQATKALCQEAMKQNVPLATLARQAYPDLPGNLFDPAAGLGDAPGAARRFAARTADL